MNYEVYGLVVQSDLPLGRRLRPSASQRCDVLVERDEVPETLSEATVRCERFDAREGAFLLRSPAGRFLVEGGSRIVVDPEDVADEVDVQTYLLGSAFGALLHQRGVLPIHASAVDVGGRAVAFVGPTGAGKSTLAAALVDRGYPLLADDVTALFATADDGFHVMAGPIGVRLCGDASERYGPGDGPVLHRSGRRDKWEHVPESSGGALERPLRSLYFLTYPGEHPGEGVELAEGVADSLKFLLLNTYRYVYVRGLGREAAHLRDCTALLERVPVHRIRRRWTLGRMETLVDLLEEHWGEIFDDGSATGPIEGGRDGR